MENNFSTIIALSIGAVILGILSFMAFPEANSTFGLVLFVGYLASTVIYGPTRNYMMRYLTKKPISQV
ncbi:MAG: hypothetical protein H6937_00730 [Burkholderiales bacterium]|nr:hypothetical protein [Burkholderiales bacterium]MDR4518352.1 hypothetical protein [Nitrosomonas sp.]